MFAKKKKSMAKQKKDESCQSTRSVVTQITKKSSFEMTLLWLLVPFCDISGQNSLLVTSKNIRHVLCGVIMKNRYVLHSTSFQPDTRSFLTQLMIDYTPDIYHVDDDMYHLQQTLLSYKSLCYVSISFHSRQRYFKFPSLQDLSSLKQLKITNKDSGAITPSFLDAESLSKNVTHLDITGPIILNGNWSVLSLKKMTIGDQVIFSNIFSFPISPNIKSFDFIHQLPFLTELRLSDHFPLKLNEFHLERLTNLKCLICTLSYGESISTDMLPPNLTVLDLTCSQFKVLKKHQLPPNVTELFLGLKSIDVSTLQPNDEIYFPWQPNDEIYLPWGNKNTWRIWLQDEKERFLKSKTEITP